MSSGDCSAYTRVEAGLGADPLGDALPVPGHHRDPAHTGLAQRLRQLARVLAQMVGHDDQADEPTVDADQDLGEPCSVAVPCGLRHRAEVVPFSSQPGMAADRHVAAVDHSGHSLARVLDGVCRLGEREPASLRLVDERLGEDVGGELVERGRQAQQLLLGDAIEGNDLLHLRGAEGHRSGLVEQHGSRLARGARSRHRP